jgi:hypothetical protein
MKDLPCIYATAFLLVLCLGAGPATPHVVAQQTDSTVGRTAAASPGDTTTGPMGVFADIERAWPEGNVAVILSHFGGGKVSISIAGTGPSGGEFSRNQSYYLLKDLFKYTTTRKFEFVQYRRSEDNERSTFAVAERHYLKTDDGRLFKDKIYVALHLEGDDDGERWVIDEIKSIR